MQKMESHRKKKPTKKEAQSLLLETFEKKAKEAHLRGLMQGSEVLSKVILDNIKEGKTLEDIKSLCEGNLRNKKTMENIILKKNRKDN